MKTYFIFIAITMLSFISVPVYPRPSNDQLCPYRIMSLAYSPDGAFIATGMDRGGIKIWDLSSGEDIIFGVNNNSAYNIIYMIKYSPDGRYIISFGGSVITIWDGRTGEEILSFLDFQIPEYMISEYNDAHLNIDKNNIIHITREFLITWDTNNSNIINIFRVGQLGIGFRPAISATAISPDGTYFAHSGSSSRNIYNIQLWNIAENRQERVLTVDRRIDVMRFSPDGNYLLTSNGTVIRLLNTRSMTEVYNIGILTGDVSVDFSPDGKHFIASWRNRIILFDTVTGKRISTFSNPPNNGRSTDAVFSPDGRFIATGLNHNIRIWNISNGEYIDIIASESEENCEYEGWGPE